MLQEKNNSLRNKDTLVTSYSHSMMLNRLKALIEEFNNKIDKIVI